jgi:hypothetical protein
MATTMMIMEEAVVAAAYRQGHKLASALAQPLGPAS